MKMGRTELVTAMMFAFDYIEGDEWHIPTYYRQKAVNVFGSNQELSIQVLRSFSDESICVETTTDDNLWVMLGLCIASRLLPPKSQAAKVYMQSRSRYSAQQLGVIESAAEEFLMPDGRRN